MNKITTAPPTLEQRIVSMLDNPNAGSETLEDLIREVSDAAATAQAGAVEARAKLTDLVASPDPRAAREAVAELETTQARLQASLPRLREKLSSAIQIERTAKFWEDHKHVKARLEIAVEQFKTFDQHSQAIVRIFLLAAEVDKEISALNSFASEIGIDRRLRSVELTARSMMQFTRDNPSLTTTTTLPDSNHSAKTIWPQRSPTAMAAEFAQTMMAPSHGGANWSSAAELARRRAAIEADQARSAAYHEQAAKDEEERINREERERFQHQRRV